MLKIKMTDRLNRGALQKGRDMKNQFNHSAAPPSQFKGIVSGDLPGVKTENGRCQPNFKSEPFKLQK
jgi:hypothetical protein